MRVGSKRLRFQKNGRRKFVIFIVVLGLIAAGIAGTVYAMGQPNGFRSLFSPEPSATATAAQLDLEGMTPSPSPIPVVTTAPSADTGQAAQSANTQPNAVQEPDGSSSDTAALVGNSNLEDLYIYNLIPDADFYYKVGLTVDELGEEAADGGSAPILEELQGKDYDKIFLMFGNNELGWHEDRFLEEYTKLIEDVRAADPGARIYVMGILPITEEISDQAIDGATQEQIDTFNEALKTLANENNCYFLDLGLAMKGSDGYLPADAAEDGVHLNLDYSVRWAEILNNEIGGEDG